MTFTMKTNTNNKGNYISHVGVAALEILHLK